MPACWSTLLLLLLLASSGAVAALIKLDAVLSVQPTTSYEHAAGSFLVAFELKLAAKGSMQPSASLPCIRRRPLEPFCTNGASQHEPSSKVAPASKVDAVESRHPPIEHAPPSCSVYDAW
jgi:hypothetical protein